MQLMDLDKYTMQKPSFWRLLFAYIIDISVLAFCCWLFLSDTCGDAVGDAMGWLLGPFFFLFLYFIICRFLFGQTFGKALVGIEVAPKSAAPQSAAAQSVKNDKAEETVYINRLSFWKLLGAYSIDMACILMSVGMIGSVPVIIELAHRLNLAPVLGDISYFFGVLLYMLVEALTGSSCGKKATGLMVQAKDFRWLRVEMSYLIDFMVFWVIFVIVFLMVSSRIEPSLAIVPALLLSFLLIVFIPLYFALCEHAFGKTLGKKLMGLTVVQKEKGA